MAQQTKHSEKSSASSQTSFVFGKVNYQLMLASILLIIIGFIMMTGKTDIYSFTKITLSPIVVIAGFALAMVSILKRPRNRS